MSPTRLVLAGTVLVDLVAAVPGLPPRGGDVVGRGRPPTVGGGRTVLAAAARGGLPTAYAGRHGAGPFGAAVRDALASDAVELLLPAEPPGGADTGYCVVLVEPDGERTMVTVVGVEAELRASDLAAVGVRSDDAVYVSGYDLVHPVSGPALAAWCAALPPDALLVCDPGPLVADVPAAVLDAVLARTDVLTLNRREAALLPRDRLTRPRAVVVRRSGPDEALVLSASDEAVLAADVPPAVEVVDTTGAGDVHTGTLVAALAQELDWPEALRAADRAAATSTTRPGPG